METRAIGAADASMCMQRANYYRFLGRLLYEELTEELIAELADSLAVIPLDDAMSEHERAFAIGTNKMAKYAQRANPDTKTESRCDYARVFLGAGSVSKMPVSPYESVYTSVDRLLMQDSRDKVCELYRAHNIAIQDSYNMPEDHIAFIFQFMGRLLDKEAQALEARNAQTAAEAHEQAKTFVAEHIANWVTRFCEEATPKAHTSFYQGLLQCIDAWTRLECELYGLDLDAIVKATIAKIREEQRRRAREAVAA